MAAPATLLIADDEETNIAILTRRLKREGYSIIDASDGEDAIEKLTGMIETPSDKPIVVLMDINMPIMNGIDATRILKEKYKDLPIIAVTACVTDSFDYKGHGFDQLCMKPVNFDELINKIESFRSAS